MANKKPTKVPYAELSRMLFELYDSEGVTLEAVDNVKGLAAWADVESLKRFNTRCALRKSGLSKLTDAERKALGFPVEVDSEDFEESDDDNDY